MKLTTWIFVLFIFCFSLTSCSDDGTEDDNLFLIEDIQENGNEDTPVNNGKGG